MRMRTGVTIVELIVVLAIIAIMLGLLFPAVQMAREKARETVCKNNLYQLNLSLGHYAEVHKELPRPSSPGQVGGWTIEILPFLEQGNLKSLIPAGMTLTDVPAPLRAPPMIFRCPRRTSLQKLSETSNWPAHYVLLATSRRESFILYDAPLSVDVPWLTGPEVSQDVLRAEKGPHHDGYFFARGFQQGIDFMPRPSNAH